MGKERTLELSTWTFCQLLLILLILSPVDFSFFLIGSLLIISLVYDLFDFVSTVVWSEVTLCGSSESQFVSQVSLICLVASNFWITRNSFTLFCLCSTIAHLSLSVTLFFPLLPWLVCLANLLLLSLGLIVSDNEILVGKYLHSIGAVQDSTFSSCLPVCEF